jgi:hypothetical protein
MRLWYHAQGYGTRGVLPRPDAQIVTVSQRYQQVYEQLCGQPFHPAEYPAQPRVARRCAARAPSSGAMPRDPGVSSRRASALRRLRPRRAAPDSA